MGSNNSTPQQANQVRACPVEEGRLCRCANEGGLCRWRDTGRSLGSRETQNVIYGANRRYNYRTVARRESIGCNDDAFGDPRPGVSKSCYHRDAPNITLGNRRQPEGFNVCAPDGGVCTPRYDSEIIYGADGRFLSGVAFANVPVPCNENTFGILPATSNRRQCFVRPTTRPIRLTN